MSSQAAPFSEGSETTLAASMSASSLGMTPTAACWVTKARWPSGSITPPTSRSLARQKALAGRKTRLASSIGEERSPATLSR